MSTITNSSILKKTFALLMCYLSIFSSKAQLRFYGSGGDEAGYGIAETIDGGFVMCGAQLLESNAKPLFIKVGSNGFLHWQRVFPNYFNCAAAKISVISGGYFVIGDISPDPNEQCDDATRPCFGGSDIWLAKLDMNGNLLQEKVLGGNGNDKATDIEVTSDGGYIISGTTDSEIFLGNTAKGGNDVFVIKLGSTMEIQWTRRIGGSRSDDGTGIEQMPDGNFFVTGFTFSNNQDITTSKGNSDLLVSKISPTGTILWIKTYGGSNADFGNDIKRTRDYHLIIAGHSFSSDGDLAGTGRRRGSDTWVIKLNSDGNIVWQKIHGTSNFEIWPSISETSNNSYIVSSHTSLTNFNPFDLASNVFLFEIKPSGQIGWQKSYRGTGNEFVNELILTSNLTVIGVGSTRSTNFDFQLANGGVDIFLLKAIFLPIKYPDPLTRFR